MCCSGTAYTLHTHLKAKFVWAITEMNMHTSWARKKTTAGERDVAAEPLPSSAMLSYQGLMLEHLLSLPDFCCAAQARGPGSHGDISL